MVTMWMMSGGLLLLAVGIVAAAGCVQGGRWLRGALAIAGGLGLIDAVINHRGPWAFGLALLLLAVNLLSTVRTGAWQQAMSDDADAFHSRHLSRLSRADAKLLIDQGQFIEARAGEELTREGQRVESLQFIVNGVAAVLVNNAIVGRVGPGDLIGEACLVPDGRASATVRLAEDHCRLWFIPRERLTAFLAAQPRIAAELNAATMTALRDKLERANKARAED